jgi:D-glycero-D-manno-heptose 1,7-bisphosphate phosphatase
MWEQLRADHHLDPQKSVIIGDKRADIAFGLNASLYTILVLTGHGRDEAHALGIPEPVDEVYELPGRIDPAPHAVAGNLGAALSWIEKRLDSR